ncbi:DNA methyltransferase [uncultured Roseobacter sp.]|uniref:DNA methyltransferase n=1 Tax=uncultured Roseobacter sp. TaxID=114847 RepID=UPI00260A9FC9|nr:DNA methyltransferase [uncultured Roseobacter sp.]
MTYQNIICGEAVETLKTFKDESVDLVVTDPPYLCKYRDRDGRSITNDTNPEAVLGVFPELYRVLKQDSYCLLFCGWNAIAQFSAAWEAAGFRVGGHIIFAKPYTSKAKHVGYCHESAWVLTKGRPAPRTNPLNDVQEWHYTGNKNHPTEKSVEVIAPLIRSFSRPGDTVLDPFLGSGTSVVAATLNGRNAIGIELNARYCRHAEQRLAGVTRYLTAKQKSTNVLEVAA